MDNKKKDSKRLGIILIGLLVVVVLFVSVFFIGESFGLFKYKKLGDIANVITLRGLDIEIVDNDASALSLVNAYPIYDSEAMSLDPFVFTMSNTTSRDISYSIKVLLDEDKLNNCKLDDGTACLGLPISNIRYMYKLDDGTFTTPQNLDTDDSVVAVGIIKTGETLKQSLVIWIDSAAGNEIMNHYFYGKIIIEGAGV